MKFNVEPITEQSRFWEQVNILAKEAFPLKEYLAPSQLVKIAQTHNFDSMCHNKKKEIEAQ